MAEERLLTLALQQVPGVTTTLMGNIIRKFNSYRDFLASEPESLEEPIARLQAGYHHRAECYLARAEQMLATLAREDIQVICIADDDYPLLLREIHRPPVLLYVRGDVANLSLPQIGIVGSRDASRAGVELAESFAGMLAASGFVITSGLALGIDAAAHAGALRQGRTVAVLGTGIDRIYPRSQADLSRRMLEGGGALVTEFTPGTPPRAENFPQRNRIISGLSLGVLVVEAAVRSGSLITARCAAEQGREVFAIPGSIHNPRSRGCHQLIRDGATLVESAADIVAQMGGMLAYKSGELAEASSCSQAIADEAANLLDNMDYAPQDMDTLVARTGLAPGPLGALLAELELSGLIESQGGLYCRIK